MRKLRISTQAQLTLLQSLAERPWGTGELHAAVLRIKNARMVYQLERWPWWQTIEYVGKHGRYHIKLPRVRYEDEKRRSVTEVVIYSTSRAHSARTEVAAFLEDLASTP